MPAPALVNCTGIGPVSAGGHAWRVAVAPTVAGRQQDYQVPIQLGWSIPPQACVDKQGVAVSSAGSDLMPTHHLKLTPLWGR